MDSSPEQIQRKKLRRDDNLYLIGNIGTWKNKILGAKLPSNRQVLSAHFHNTRNERMSLSASVKLVAEEVAEFYSKARIPVAEPQNNMAKIERLVKEYKSLQKGSGRGNSSSQIEKERVFVDKLDDLFDMSHQDAMHLIKDTDVREFLSAQRKKGRVGCLLGFAQKEQSIEEAQELRVSQEQARKEKAANESMTNGIYF